MEYSIKLLSLNSLVFFPQTSSEAVLVKDNGETTTLDKVLTKKIENIITPAGSGLLAFKLNLSIILTHTNSIEANLYPSPILIKYDNRGHIIESVPFNKLKVKVNTELYSEYNGLNDSEILMGDDFGIDLNNNITLKWTNI